MDDAGQTQVDHHIENSPESSDYQVGDVPQTDGPPPPRPRPSFAPWLLVFALLAAGALFAYLAYLPLRSEAQQLGYKLAEANTNVDKLTRKVTELEEVRQKLEDGQAELAVALQVKEQALKELTSTEEELAEKLDAEIKKGDVLIKQRQGELVVDLVDRVLFDSGEATLNQQGKDVLAKVADTFLKIKDKVIQVGGHTDDMPISDRLAATYPSNWELSTARAVNVVHFLEDTGKIPGSRLVAAGFSQFRPVASNTTKTGRKRNRRIEVVLLPVRPKE